MLLEKWNKGASKSLPPSAPTGSKRLRLILVDRGGLILKPMGPVDKEKARKAVAWIKRNAAKNAERGLTETGASVLRKLRDGKLKA